MSVVGFGVGSEIERIIVRVGIIRHQGVRSADKQGSIDAGPVLIGEAMGGLLTTLKVTVAVLQSPRLSQI